MILAKALTLLFVTLVPGLLVIRLSKVNKWNFRFLLIFSGAFLLSITILHILPELFAHAEHRVGIAIFILIGLFVQMTLESFTSGIEHGHWHDHGLEKRSMAFPIGLTAALCIHSLLEGAILAHDGHSHGHGMYDTLMFGVALHKIPAAIALVSVLMSEMKNTRMALIILSVFAISSPAGLLISEYLQNVNVILESGFDVIMALAAGSFIYISATILFEARKDHRIKLSNIIPALLGAGIAILAEILI
jgi:zinc transporter ZupT